MRKEFKVSPKNFTRCSPPPPTSFFHPFPRSRRLALSSLSHKLPSAREALPSRSFFRGGGDGGARGEGGGGRRGAGAVVAAEKYLHIYSLRSRINSRRAQSRAETTTTTTSVLRISSPIKPDQSNGFMREKSSRVS